MLQHPPISTPFPYTTLSDLGRRDGRPGEVRLRAGTQEHEQSVLRPGSRRLQEGRGGVERCVRMHVYRPRPSCNRREPGDRKSTRLNSSHLGISYAVFCCKKKASISFSTRPRPYTSLPPATTWFARACSRISYSGVPSAIASAGTRLPTGALIARAMTTCA